jgi:hypothetical protein
MPENVCHQVDWHPSLYLVHHLRLAKLLGAVHQLIETLLAGNSTSISPNFAPPKTRSFVLLPSADHRKTGYRLLCMTA